MTMVTVMTENMVETKLGTVPDFVSAEPHLRLTDDALHLL